jgi:hypothetical protein
LFAALNSVEVSAAMALPVKIQAVAMANTRRGNNFRLLDIFRG